MTINCFKTVSAKGLIYLPVALRRFVGIHEDDGVPERSPAAKPFLRSKNTDGYRKEVRRQSRFCGAKILTSADNRKGRDYFNQ